MFATVRYNLVIFVVVRMNSMDDLDVNDDNGSVYGLGKQMSYDGDTE